MRLLYLVSVWLHILAAGIWVGSLILVAVALVPLIRHPEYRTIAPSILQWTGERVRWVAWACFGVLILTGIFNLAYRGFGWADIWNGRLWQGPFGRALSHKLILVAVILSLSAWHDFIIGPRATHLWQDNPDAQEAKRLRRRAGWIGRINLVLTLAVIAFGIMLVRGWP